MIIRRKKWRTLYKLSNTGALMQWRIWTENNSIFTEFGQVDGKLQQTVDIVKNGKSLGKVNRTTPTEQAQAEARSKHMKQKKKGYTAVKELALAGKVDESVIQGGLFPMLAKEFSKAKQHLKYPCAVQPKLDGIRMVYTGGGLWSRTRKPIERLPHILEALEALEVRFLDGEGYNHDLKEDFEEIVGKITSKNEVAEGFEKIQYHIYDLPDEKLSFEERLEVLQDLFRYVPEDSPIKLVPTVIVNDEAELLKAYEDFLEQGYEGAMARNLHAKYETKKRSSHLQKVKQFQDAEFKIVGIREGKGKLMGHVAAFILEIDDKHGKREFKAKMKGNTEFLKKCFKDHSLWKNRWMTVQFQGWTRANNKPRFPVALRLRDKDY